ncbi:MAG TPA: helix-turn-helix domain-containing protein [Pyrinomonadaceae bacterium]|jgi:tetratricopeptide (TPR) repeat protein
MAGIEKGLPHMTLADERLKELDNPSLTEKERVLLRCRVAADFIHTGRYEAAREALGDLWRGIGDRPKVAGLDEQATAEVLLQVGVLSGWLGVSRQVTGAQEAAKDLISESAALFEGIGEAKRAANARADLSICYWREGAFEEARAVLESAAALIEENTELKAKTILCFAIVESSAGRYGDTFRLLTDSAPLFGEGLSHRLRGIFHNELAIVLRRLGTAEHRTDYLDRAIIEYTAAIYHYEQAGHERYKATNQNNLAFLLHKLGRYREAHEQLDRAGATLFRLKDAGLLAQVDETRASVFIAEKKYREADRVIARAIETLEKGGESALLAEALTTQGVVRARLGASDESMNILRRAMRVAEDAGALSNAGLAALALIEEHGARRVMLHGELYSLYRRADELLKGSQDAEDKERLLGCARIVMRRIIVGELHDKNFSLFSAVHDLEARLIEQALEESGGSITKAARLLGVNHQTLGSMLRTRHKGLLKKRTPAEKRLRSIIKKDA